MSNFNSDILIIQEFDNYFIAINQLGISDYCYTTMVLLYLKNSIKMPKSKMANMHHFAQNKALSLKVSVIT